MININALSRGENSKFPLWVLGGFLFFFQIYFGIVPGWKKITADFPNYYVSAKLLTEEKDLSCLYDNALFNEQAKQYGINIKAQYALNPPPNALIFLPIAGFNPLTAKRLWMVFNVVLIFVCVFLIKKITGWHFIFSMNILLLTGFALANDLFLGQIYLFLTVLLLSGYLLFQQNKNYLTGISWGSVIALKYVPIVFLPALILKKEWKLFLSVIAVFLFINLICLPFFGLNVYWHFVKNIFFPYVNGSLYEGKPYSLQYQSWESLLNNLFMHDKNRNPHPVIDFPSGYIICKGIVWLSIMGILIYFYIKAFNNKYFFEIIFPLSVISLLILEPSSATYHLLFLIFPFIILMKILIDEKDGKACHILLILFSMDSYKKIRMVF